MASFQAKIGWKRLRKSENKNYPSVPFLPEKERKEKLSCRSIFTRGVVENSKKMAKKFKKFKKYHCGFILSQNTLEKAGKERK